MDPLTRKPSPPQFSHEWLVTTGIRICIILAVTFLIVRLGAIFFRRLEKRLYRDPGDDLREIEAQKRLRTLIGIFRATAYTGIISVAILTILTELNVNLGPVIAAAGIGGLAIGFGAQTLVKDVISGFFLLLEDQIRVGDLARINGCDGTVEQITFRYVRLRDNVGAVHYITNGSIVQVTNLTKEYSYFPFAITLPHREDPEPVMRLLKKVGEELSADPAYKEDILAPVEVQGIESFSDSGYVVRGRIKTQPADQFKVGREFHLRLKKALDGAGIELATRPVVVEPRAH